MSKHKQNMQRRLSMGKGLGLGHGGNTKLPALQSFELPAEVEIGLEPNTRAYMLGQCRVLTAPPHGSRGWHMSIAHKTRYPTWDEIAKAWYETVPDSEQRIACMVLPPRSEYVNIANYCFHIHELQQSADGVVQLDSNGL